jgi:hypothetical protein
MNELFFACPTCREKTDAGYRWAYLLLEKPNIVTLGSAVDVDRVLNAIDYWTPPEGSRPWLVDEILPTVRRFLLEHCDHGIVFWEDDHVPDDFTLEWRDIGVKNVYPTARHLVEVERLEDWDSVEKFIEAHPLTPWNPQSAADRDRFRAAFERHLARFRAVGHTRP